jgi:hypothetical protein
MNYELEGIYPVGNDGTINATNSLLFVYWVFRSPAYRWTKPIDMQNCWVITLGSND